MKASRLHYILLQFSGFALHGLEFNTLPTQYIRAHSAKILRKCKILGLVTGYMEIGLGLV